MPEETTYESPSLDEMFSETPKETKPEEASPPNGGTEVKEEKAVETEEKEESPKGGQKEETSPEEGSLEDSTDWKKRYEDTQSWANESHKSALKAQEEIKKLREEYGVEEPPEDAEQNMALMEERVRTSEAIERERHGNEFIDKTLYAEDSLWRTIRMEPINEFRVKNAVSPVTEALKIVKEHEFTLKYGNDPDKIRSGMKAELEKELRAEITKEFNEKIKNKEKLGGDLSGVKSEEVKEKTFKPSSTEQLFG